MAVREPGAARQDAAAAVDIVIVNWNAGALLHQCIQSIAATLGDDPRLGRVVVVDNASTDGSWRLDDEGLPLVLIRNERNLGFAAACNQGARDSAAEALLFLNPDTRLLPSAVQGALDHLAAPPNARTGIVGIQLVDMTGTVHRSCARFPTPGRMIGAAFGLDRLLLGPQPAEL